MGSLPLPGAWIKINRMTNGTQIFYTTDEESNMCLLCAYCMPFVIHCLLNSERKLKNRCRPLLP